MQTYLKYSEKKIAHFYKVMGIIKVAVITQNALILSYKWFQAATSSLIDVYDYSNYELNNRLMLNVNLLYICKTNVRINVP